MVCLSESKRWVFEKSSSTVNNRNILYFILFRLDCRSFFFFFSYYYEYFVGDLWASMFACLRVYLFSRATMVRHFHWSGIKTPQYTTRRQHTERIHGIFCLEILIIYTLYINVQRERREKLSSLEKTLWTQYVRKGMYDHISTMWEYVSVCRVLERKSYHYTVLWAVIWQQAATITLFVRHQCDAATVMMATAPTTSTTIATTIGTLKHSY